MSEFAVEDVFPPVAIGETPRAMPAGIHFAPFVVALIETIEYRMEGAFPVYKQRVAAPRSELGQVQKLVEVYLRRHFSTLAEHSVKVRQLLLSNMNIGLYEGMKALAVQGGELYRKHTYAAPAPVTGNFMVTPTLRKLGALAEEGYESSLAEHSAHLKPNAVGASGVKRKGTPGAGAGSPRSGPSRGGGGHPLQGPNAALEDACGDMSLLVAWLPLREAHMFVCTRPGRQDSRAAATAGSRKRCRCRRHPHRRRRNSSRRNRQRQEGAEQEGPNAVRFCRNHLPAGGGGGGRGNGGNN